MCTQSSFGAHRRVHFDIELAQNHSKDMASGSGAEAILVHVPKGFTQPASDTQTDR